MQQKITRSQILQYYSDERISSQIFRYSTGREVAGALWDGSYDKRPNMLQFPSDVVQMARKGITSFHYSAERWSNPMALTSSNYSELRTGWDVVIDIDSKKGLDESKTGAMLVCRFLDKYGIKNHTVKFSGRRGFHIILSWEMFPTEIDDKPLSKLYPEVPRIIAGFIRERIQEDMKLELGTPEPYSVVEIEKDWGNRHMFRAPFSFNEKTWLVSLPIRASEIRSFEPEQAAFDKVLSMEEHIGIMEAEKDEASNLLLDAVDWNASTKLYDEKKPPRGKKFDGRIGEDAFPPCMKAILGGMSDGRKRSVFTLINFLRMMNWTMEEIEQRVYEWNEKNSPPLPRVVIAGQLNHAVRREKAPPANCSLSMYYSDIGICRPDSICFGRNKIPSISQITPFSADGRGTSEIKIKNPVNYPFRRPGTRKKRGFSCICGEEFETMKALNNHKSRNH